MLFVSVCSEEWLLVPSALTMKGNEILEAGFMTLATFNGPDKVHPKSKRRCYCVVDRCRSPGSILFAPEHQGSSMSIEFDRFL